MDNDSRIMSQSIPTGYIPPGKPRGFAQKNCPGGRDLTFESCPGAGNSTRAGIFWNVQTMLNACSGGDLCFSFLTILISETPCMKVGLEVRISFVSILSTGGGSFPPPSPPKKSFFLNKLKAISNTDHI